MSANGYSIKKVRVASLHNETALAKTFILEPLDGWMPSYKAGQFLSFIFQTPHGEKRRSYSISSSPELGEALSITVKKIDNGEFSRVMIYDIKEGDVLDTIGVGGLFVLPPETKEIKQFYFLAAGSGISPCIALIKTLLNTTTPEVVLIYSNKSEEDTIFLHQLQSLQSEYAQRFSIRFLYSNRFSVYHSRISKWLLLHLLKEYPIHSKEQVYFYLCGPYDYMQTLRITLLGESIPAEHIIRENFSSLARVTLPKPPDTAAHEVTVKINEQEHRFTVQYPQSILAAAKSNGVHLPYSCEAGRCASCIATCTQGKIWMAYNEVLTDSEILKGRILTCQGFPVDGNATITFQDI